MTVIRPNSISGINSITGQGGDISIFRADGTAADVTVNNITSGVVTATTFSGNLSGGNVTIANDLTVNGDVTLGDNVSIKSNVVLQNVSIGDNSIIESFSHLSSASVGSNCNIGPYARLREGSEIGDSAKIGNFVETKKTKLGNGAKANHLAYLGDANIGDKTNVGAGTITCNYDGTNKHKTTIGNDSFIGTNSSLVAPVNIGKGAYVGAGSVITKDVPDEALAVGRGKQVIKEDWAKNKK